MTVASETPIATATANGVTTVFPYAFTVLKTGDVKVQGVLGGAVTVYTFGVDYTLSGIGTPAGSVNFVAAPANGTIITSYRDTPLTRSTDYQTAGDLFADIIDADFDRMWLTLQEIVNGSRSSSRALQVPVGETVNALPVLATRASKFLAFDGSGQPVAAAGVTGSPATSFGASLIAVATAALARGVLGSGVTGDALFLTTTAAAARALVGGAAAGANSDITSLSGLTTPLSAAQGGASLQPLPTPTLNANAMTIPAATYGLSFRSATLATGGAATLVQGAVAALTIPSGATLGAVSATQADFVVAVMNNGGALEYAVANVSGGLDMTETGLMSTTAISAAATSASVWYSTTSRASLPYRIVGLIRNTQATAGTYVTAPSLVQGAGGQAVTAMSSIGYGQTWQSVVRNGSTTYYNTTGRPIMLTQYASAGAGTSTLTVGGVVVGQLTYNSTGGVMVAIVPPGVSYSWSGTTVNSLELR